MVRTSIAVVAALITLSVPAAALANDDVPLEGAAASPESCNEPVILIVWVDGFDRAKSKAYGDGLRSTKIVPRHGGRYIAVSPPVEVLEGAWPAERAVVVEQYPCQQAFREMWFSREYEDKLKPLRAGTGDYKIALFKLRSLPTTPSSNDRKP